jgi:hypothetical protein
LCVSIFFFFMMPLSHDSTLPDFVRPEERIQHSPPALWLGLCVSPDARQSLQA